MPIRSLKTLAPAREEDLHSTMTDNNEVFIVLHPPDTHPNLTNLNPHWRGVSQEVLTQRSVDLIVVVEGTRLTWVSNVRRVS